MKTCSVSINHPDLIQSAETADLEESNDSECFDDRILSCGGQNIDLCLFVRDSIDGYFW